METDSRALARSWAASLLLVLAAASACIVDPPAPVAMIEAPGRPGRWYAVEQPGRVVAFDDRADATTSSFVDLTDRVFSGAQEAGLLGMAFHPQYAQNRRVFLSYTVKVAAKLRSRVSRFVATTSTTAIDKSSAEVLLEFDRPFDNRAEKSAW